MEGAAKKKTNFVNPMEGAAFQKTNFVNIPRSIPLKRGERGRFFVQKHKIFPFSKIIVKK